MGKMVAFRDRSQKEKCIHMNRTDMEVYDQQEFQRVPFQRKCINLI